MWKLIGERVRRSGLIYNTYESFILIFHIKSSLYTVACIKESLPLGLFHQGMQNHPDEIDAYHYQRVGQKLKTQYVKLLSLHIISPLV